MSVAGRAVQPFMPAAEAQDPRAPGPFAFADPRWIEEILTESGFSGIEIESITPDVRVGGTVEEAMYFEGRIGPLARAIAELDEETQKKANEAARAALGPWPTGCRICCCRYSGGGIFCRRCLFGPRLCRARGGTAPMVETAAFGQRLSDSQGRRGHARCAVWVGSSASCGSSGAW